MTEKVAEIEVKLSLNDREYASSAKNAEKSTEALTGSVEELQEGLEDAGKTASEAGEDLEKMGKKATTARGALNNLRREAKYLMSFGGVAGLLGGGAIGGLLGSAIGASAENAKIMQQMGLAAGGNQSMFSTMNDLYRQINSSSPISKEGAANISAQVTKRFGFLSDTERSQLASKLTAADESGDDVTLIVKSLEKIAKMYGTNKPGKFNASEMLDMLQYTANQTNESLSSVAATTASLAGAGNKHKMDAKTMQQFLLMGYLKGNDLSQTAESILRGITATDAENALKRPSNRRPTWMGVHDAEFADVDMMPYGYLSPSTGLVPTKAALQHRKAEMAKKSLGEWWGGVGDALVTAPDDYWQWRMRGGRNQRAERDFLNYRRLEDSGARPQNYIVNTINQYFTSSDSPTTAMRHALENEAKKLAQR